MFNERVISQILRGSNSVENHENKLGVDTIPDPPESTPLESPILTISVKDIVATISWNATPGSTGYNFCFDIAQPDVPFDGKFFDCIDMGDLSGSFPIELWEGAGFHIGIQSYNESSTSDTSNIESFFIPLTNVPARDNDHDGFSVEDGDCNDNKANIHPGAEEILLDGIDQDCQRGPFD